MTVTILTGDARDMLATLPAGSCRCCVTSPPYHQLRDYGVAGQIGLESEPAEYIAALVGVFREVRRVLADDGTCWIVLGDCFGKGKQLQLMPHRVALALQADGWYLRSNIVWHKPNPMPESVRDRPTSAHESVFLLTKRARYYYDADAVKLPASQRTTPQKRPAVTPDGAESRLRNDEGRLGGGSVGAADGRVNLRNIWTITPKPYGGAHFATFPPELVERCIKAGSAVGDTVLDPFFGAGTTGLVADRLGRHCVGIELNPSYAELARERIGLAAIPQLEAAD
jgi:DNA modification methylase